MWRTKEGSIDDLCPAAVSIHSIMRKDGYMCKSGALLPCYSPRQFKGCAEYNTFLKVEAVAKDYRVDVGATHRYNGNRRA